MEIAADEAKLALDVIGDSGSRSNLGQTRTIENRLKNVCLKLRANKNSVLEFLNSKYTNTGVFESGYFKSKILSIVTAE